MDDEPSFRRVVRESLEKLGVVCEEAGDCEEALKHARSGPIDVCILDNRLPGVSGIMCSPQLKGVQPSMRVVLCTGFPDGITQEDLERAGVLTLLSKPLRIDDLRQLFSDFNL